METSEAQTHQQAADFAEAMVEAESVIRALAERFALEPTEVAASLLEILKEEER